MIIAGLQVGARREVWIWLDGVDNLLWALPGVHACEHLVNDDPEILRRFCQ
jgi:hypothetical protein